MNENTVKSNYTKGSMGSSLSEIFEYFKAIRDDNKTTTSSRYLSDYLTYFTKEDQDSGKDGRK